VTHRKIRPRVGSRRAAAQSAYERGGGQHGKETQGARGAGTPIIHPSRALGCTTGRVTDSEGGDHLPSPPWPPFPPDFTTGREPLRGLSNAARTPLLPWGRGRTAQPRPRKHRGDRTGRLRGLAAPEGLGRMNTPLALAVILGVAPGADSVQPAVTGSWRPERQQSVPTTTGMEYGRTHPTGAYARGKQG